MRRSVIMIVMGLSSACAAGVAEQRPTVEMDAVVIRHEAPADLPTDTYDADTVLHYAREAERAREYAKSRRLYERLLNEFPESKLGRSARFGAARSQEALEGCSVVLPKYAAIRAEDPDLGDVGDWVDVHFREASCLLALARAGDAADLLSELIKYPGLTKTDRLEAMVGRGIANKDRDEIDLAERDLVMVIAIDRENNGDSSKYMGAEIETRFIVAKAAYHLGEVYRLRFERTKLEYPQAMLEARLEEKSQYLLRAQAYLLRSIRLGSLEVAAAAGFRVGGMYEKFHQELIALEPPPELTESQQKLYMQELRLKIAILLRKAVKIYDEAVAMAKRTGLKSDWIDKANEALDRIKKTYLVDISG
ncbi:MAG: hypothetical protein IT381_17150 [Deltaproteobacteria bacterium]|nr:hypothetical protein [Deltaproteobacteria bacterium]